MTSTADDIRNLTNRIKRFAERNNAMNYVGVRRCIRHLGRALQAGNAGRSICLTLAHREFVALTASIRQRKGKLV